MGCWLAAGRHASSEELGSATTPGAMYAANLICAHSPVLACRLSQAAFAFISSLKLGLNLVSRESGSLPPPNQFDPVHRIPGARRSNLVLQLSA